MTRTCEEIASLLDEEDKVALPEQEERQAAWPAFPPADIANDDEEGHAERDRIWGE